METNRIIIYDILQGCVKYKGLAKYYQNIVKSNEIPDELCKYGMIFLGPDSFYQDQIMNIFTFMISKGFRIVDIRFRRKLTRSEMENTFLPDSTCTECGNLKWWVIADIAKLGIFAEAIIYQPDATLQKNCLNTLNEFKGKSNPFINDKKTIRGNENVINELFNLVHVPDDYCDFIKDCMPFYSLNEVIDIIKIHQQNNLLEDKKIFLDKRQLFEIEYHSKKRKEKKSLFKTLYYLKYELLSLLSNYGEEIIQLQDVIIEYLKFVDNETDRIRCLKKMRIINTSENKLISTVQTKLDTLFVGHEMNDDKFLSIIMDYKILVYYHILSNENEFYKVSEEMMGDLINMGIDMDEFDKHIVLTSCLLWDTKGI